MFSFWKCIIYVLPNDNKIINYNNNLYYSSRLLRLLNENDMQNIISIAYGSYRGNNQSSKTINLGFKPKAVILASTSYYRPNQDFDNGNEMLFYYATCGIENVNGNIQITQNGFVVSRGMVNNIYLNLYNNEYGYIAFRSLT